MRGKKKKKCKKKKRGEKRKNVKKKKGEGKKKYNYFRSLYLIYIHSLLKTILPQLIFYFHS